MDNPIIRVCVDGPLLVRGPVTIERTDGTTLEIERGPIALCRCGKTASAPFCDASHKNARAAGRPADSA